MDIRRETVIVLRRGVLFLGGRILWSNDIRWRRSPYEAWQTRDRAKAERVAKATGCDMWLFNPVVGQLREMTKGGLTVGKQDTGTDLRDGQPGNGRDPV